ncbi:triple tyrosine motif-containing protein [Polaribacter sp. HL-MS24]|uniref:helix-turn-helix and ligand-binding sensor domain-containing protein n=1 Tax=Polaribacter sp. HL-MS24 TaxID=3077735 RepID=UPI0029349A10|nr:triple tyrosine motif-containing protein [Polaribacter sp. HL-MS24]WOC40426.1 triple tyrosine motif-containing protein [Polaribacter sp. HL-MS24]
MYRFFSKFAILLFLVCCNFSSFAQELPPITTYTTEDYGAENQNWGISQSETKFIYVANNLGLLEFNGASWQLYETPNSTIMRSVRAYKNKIFTGFYMDFGFWEKNNFGTLEYSSIVKNQQIQMLDDEQIWSILEVDGWLLFKSLQRIYLYNLQTKEVNIINAENRIHKLSSTKSGIYFQEDKKGIFKIENGVPKLISDAPIFKENSIVEIFERENQLLFLTQEEGFYYLKDKKPIKWSLPSEILENKIIYSAIQLKDKNFLLGTISNGLINLKENGAVDYQVNKSSGISNNTILSVFEDSEQNIWLGLDNGINCINNKSLFKKNNTKNYYLGTIYASIIYNQNLYLGTNQGLFYRAKNSVKPFSLIKNTQGQVWSLTEIDGVLFCGHNSGTFIIDNGVAKNIFPNQGTWNIQKLTDSTLLLGSYDGLYVLENKNRSWQLKNKIKGFENSSKYVVLHNGQIFVDHEYKGVFKISVDKDFTEVLSVVKDTSLQKGIHSSILKYQNNLLYANKKGVFFYNEEKDLFQKDSVYSQLIDSENFISAKLIHNPLQNRLWSFSKDQINYLTLGKLNNQPKVQTIYISEFLPKAVSGYESIIHLENEKYLIGTSDGFLEMDLNSLKKPIDFEIHINKINSFKYDGQKKEVDLTMDQEFHNSENNLEFFFSVPNFNSVTATKYQYQLLGKNKKWSLPSKSSSVLFENIPYGNFTFKVRGVVSGKLSENIASYQFEIQRPWYFSNALISVYVFAFLLFLYFFHLASKRYYKNQREKLLERAQKELELKELESTQKIIKINNEKLRNDIENKNRELAISTMNIIKKNEFLNSIKSELINSDLKQNSSVVKIIDKNLNNTDDWKMFQEAFNNADKNFLKKVKSKHPNLTPNDLRLCAYLRLNLSSKEIAPLLNISPRSVEVKRYRLRKKMSLPHDSNLTNYILEI